MNPLGPSDNEFKFKTSRQERIFKKLRLIGFAPAAYYRDACRLATLEPPLDSITLTVGHLFREIESMVVDFLLDEADRKALANQKDAWKRKIRAVMKNLGIEEDHEIADLWLESESLHKYAHRNGIAKPRSVGADFHEMLEKHEEILDYVLHRFESNYFEYHKRLDDLLDVPNPTQKVMKDLRNYIPNNMVSLTSLFERLPLNSEWLLVLDKNGFFDGPADPEPDAETDGRLFPRWPAGSYLIKMAEVNPTEVMNIALKVNDKLNPYVQYELIETATKMPPDEAGRLVPKIKDWLRTRRFPVQDCAKLVIYLARSGCIDEAIDLARELLAVGFVDESTGSFSLWDYNHLIEEISPIFIEVSGLQALKLFCDLLGEALRLNWENPDKADGRDYSYTWRAQIELAPDQRYYELHNILVTAVRDCSVTLVRNNPSLISCVVDELEVRLWPVFYRLALHLLCEFPNDSLDLISQRLKQFHRYDDRHFFNEYYRLARIALPLLDSLDQNDILNLIQAGPDEGKIRRWMENNGKEITDDAVQQKVRYWAKNYLAELRPLLDESRKLFLEELERELGEAEPLVRPYTSSISWGSHLPQDVPEFGSMTVNDIVSFLESWGPSMNGPDCSPDHIWQELYRAIKQVPEKFCQHISGFKKVDPTYMKHLFRAFRDAHRENHPVTWSSVLDLAEWVVSQGREIPGRSVDSFDWDIDWGETRVEIVDLVHAGLETRTGGISSEFRDLVWKVLEPLTRDPEPTSQYEQKMIGPRQEPLPLVGDGNFLDSHSHPHGVAINAVRCLALRTVLQYGRWVKHNILFNQNQDERTVCDFEQMPEVKQLLDFHVDPRNDCSIAIGYVYGAEFPLIYWLDRKWAEENKNQVFSRSGEQLERGAAAWEGYLRSPFDHYYHLFDVLRSQYEQAVNQLGMPCSETGHFINPDLALGYHLRNLYLLGKIRLESPQSIWKEYFEKADDETVSKLISDIGWEMSGKREFPGDWLDKLGNLWEWRISYISAAQNRAAHAKELKAFGSWFASGKFDDAWALERLREVLVINDKVKSDEVVINRLADLVDQSSIEVLECAILMARGITNGARLYYWRDGLKRIISAMRNAEDPQLQEKCKELVSILLSKGFSDFKDSALAIKPNTCENNPQEFPQ